jgi:hypothetical protein
VAIDSSGISLSTADPDNLNFPSGSGLSDEIEDYCSAELLHGDSIAAMLNAAVSSPNAGRSGSGRGSAMPKRRMACGGSQNRIYWILAGVIVILVVGVIIFDSEG